MSKIFFIKDNEDFNIKFKKKKIEKCKTCFTMTY